MRLYKISKLFGKKVQRLRKSMDLSQEDLAEKVGIHRNHVGRIERGETNPPLPTIEKIARALKVKPDELLRI